MKEVNQLFEKAINLKPGDTTVMREYAYCTPDKRYAETFSSGYDGKGLMYEIFIPKGARVSRGGDYTLPRHSRFRCISNERLENGSHKIKLEYILPDESW